MSSMSTCSSCSGLVPERQLQCPHCDAEVPPKRRSRLAAAFTLASAGVASVTLMACYGMPANCEYTDSTGATKSNGVYCKDTCVAPESDAAKHCYDYDTDAGKGDAGTADAGSHDAGTKDGG